jgi:hypothetical protein
MQRPVPPARMPLVYRRRPLKRWRYVGVYGEEVMLCAGNVHVAGIPQAFWAVWDRRGRRLYERTIVLRTAAVDVGTGAVRVDDRDASVNLRLEPAGEPIEVVSDHGRAHIWTRKVPIATSGTVTAGGQELEVNAAGLIDESAGYHARHTAWEWSAGVGTTTDGRSAVWNLVAGVHDAVTGSERAVWLDGAPQEVGPSVFGPDLATVAYPEGALEFTAETERRRTDRMVLLSSDYVQPFGTFAGNLAPGVSLASGFGVMERHRATW